MKSIFAKVILALVVPFILGIASSQALAEVHWEKTFGGTNTDLANSIQQTDDGGYIIAGHTNSFGAGGDAYLIKTDADGNELWSKNYGGTNYDSAMSIQQTDDGGYIIAGTTDSFGPNPSNIYLIKTDADGNELWSKAHDYGEFNDRGSSVDQTEDGGYIIAGTTGPYGAESFYLLKTDAEGNKLWDKTFGGDSSENGLSGQQTSDGGYIITGNTRSFGAGGSDVYLVKTDPNGEQIWDTTFGGAGQDLGWSVQETSDGGYIIVGSTESFGVSHGSFYLIKTDAEGKEIWSNYFADYGNGRSVQETFDGGYIVAGSVYGYLGVRLLKTDANGNLLWTKTFGENGQAWANSVRQTFDGGYIAAGLINPDFSGDSDVYLIYFKPYDGTPQAICQDVTVPTKPGTCSADASIDDGSFDPDGDPITLEQAPPCPYGLGETDVTLTVTDDKDAFDTCDATVTVIDEEDPVISSVSANPKKLWPPNHKMVPVTVTVDATDNCDSTCQIISVASNEPVNGLGDGDTAPDWLITGELTVKLRAERSGKGNGRIYTIIVECADSSGNSSTDTTTVRVPHDKGKENQNNKKKK